MKSLQKPERFHKTNEQIEPVMSRENILVVEDEKDIQELIRYNLASELYNVTCVGSGEDALKTTR